MTHDEAIQFLRAHQPMTPTDQIKDADAQTYNEVRRFFLSSPDKACIPLFLNSFGDGDCFGVYQLVEDVIAPFEAGAVVPHLAMSLRSPHRSIRYWSAQISTRFPSFKLIDALAELLREDDFDLRYASVTALEQIGGERVRDVLQAHRSQEDDDEIVELIDEVLKELSE